MYFPLLNTVFIHIPKTAGTSIRKGLMKHSKYKSAAANKSPHNTIRQMTKKFGQDVIGDSFSFTIVRNPWERMVSLYLMHQRLSVKNKHQNFRQFIAKLNNPNIKVKHVPKSFHSNQLKWVLDKKGNVGVDKIYLFENLDSAWRDICLNIEIDHFDLGHSNKSEYNRSYHYYYDNVTRPIVTRWHKKDIDYFGFEFD